LAGDNWQEIIGRKNIATKSQKTKEKKKISKKAQNFYTEVV
jgi:hypothetical protein